jgi:hypothetical protein
LVPHRGYLLRLRACCAFLRCWRGGLEGLRPVGASPKIRSRASARWRAKSRSCLGSLRFSAVFLWIAIIWRWVSRSTQRKRAASARCSCSGSRDGWLRRVMEESVSIFLPLDLLEKPDASGPKHLTMSLRRTSLEQRQRLEPAGKCRLAGQAEPIFQHRGIDAPEIQAHFEIAVLQVR